MEEKDSNHLVYTTTDYSYDTLGNLTQVADEDGNNVNMTYDWLSRKTIMADPDMGGWSYTYDAVGNLVTQTDNNSQTITFGYVNPLSVLPNVRMEG